MRFMKTIYSGTVEKEYKGIKYEVDMSSYKIHLPNGTIRNFQAYFGNRVFSMSEDSAIRLMNNRAIAEIKKYLAKR
jgi:hypothetical protein